jgi:polyhydroxyalkanoate synthesis regulator protein
MQGLVPRYLEEAMAAFAQHQEQVRTTMQRTMGGLFPFGNMQEVGRQNIAMMERAFSMFSPFRPSGEDADQASTDPAQQEVAALRAEVERLRRELATLKGER